MTRFFAAIPLASLALVALQSCSSPQPGETPAPNDTATFYSANDFSTVPKTDAHVHIQVSDSVFLNQAKADNFHLFSIDYDDKNEPPPMEVQEAYAQTLLKSFPNNFQYATTISVRKFNDDPDWTANSIAYVRTSMSKGARAVKIYKVIGMSLRDKKGKLVMIDDPRFDSLFSFFERNHIPILGHLGEPRNCWLPAEKMTVRGDSSYFTQWPVYHMYKHPEMPSYEDQIRARDNMLAKHPALTFVGAHLGSLEWNVDSLAARLDRFPNMSVDMAARVVHLEVQARNNWQKVHDFLIKYNDRLLYATDLVINESASKAEANESAHATWTSDWKFFTSDGEMTSDQFDGIFKGMKLPKYVIDNIYRKNAQKQFGIFNDEAP